jgi:hypothetical protein
MCGYDLFMKGVHRPINVKKFQTHIYKFKKCNKCLYSFITIMLWNKKKRLKCFLNNKEKIAIIQMIRRL